MTPHESNKLSQEYLSRLQLNEVGNDTGEIKKGTVAILKTAEQLFVPDGTPVKLPISIPFSMDGQQYNLTYSMEPSNNSDVITLNLSVDLPQQQLEPDEMGAVAGVMLQNDEVAKRSFIFKAEGTIVKGTSVSLTRAGFEGQGMALGLGYLSNLVAEDLRARGAFPQAENLVSVIADQAVQSSSEGNSRKGWSGTLAKNLGYQMNPFSPANRREYTKVLPWSAKE